MTSIFVLGPMILSALPVRAEVKVSPVFSDNMVLQRGQRIPVWGTAEPGQKVSVYLNRTTAECTADEEGRWKAELDTLPAGGPYTMTVSAGETLTFKNVMIGEVWVCSGQSNMQWSVGMSNQADSEIASATDTGLRLLSVNQTVAETPQENPSLKHAWVETSPEMVKEFSAVAYFFGRKLREDLNVPVGLIHTSWGGTPAQAWTPRETLEAHPELAHYTAPRDSAKPIDANTPSVLYNAMIAPLVPYAIQGAIWYQGESNAGQAVEYRTLFPAMIESSREAWDQKYFPFLFVQLANWQARRPEPSESSWAMLREAQTMTLSLPNTGMAVTIDIGDAEDIHPRNKQDVGKRLALAAEAVVYKKKVPYSGPMFESMQVKGGDAILRFSHTDGGLVTGDGGPLRGFAIAGEDRVFVWADAAIDGDRVIVSSEKVEKPVAVRYGWADNPEVNLYNQAGLPASPFRTDEW